MLHFLPRTPALLFLMACAAWAIWYFGKLLKRGLETGDLIDSMPFDGVPVTRAGKPGIFWFSMGLAVAVILSSLWVVISVAGDFLGFWRTDFDNFL